MGYSKERKKIREEIEFGFLKCNSLQVRWNRKLKIMYMNLYSNRRDFSIKIWDSGNWR